MESNPIRYMLNHISNEIKSADSYVRSARTNADDEEVRNLYLDLAIGELLDISAMTDYISHTFDKG